MKSLALAPLLVFMPKVVGEETTVSSKKTRDAFEAFRYFRGARRSGTKYVGKTSLSGEKTCMTNNFIKCRKSDRVVLGKGTRLHEYAIIPLEKLDEAMWEKLIRN
jgi:hypothetical protein